MTAAWSPCATPHHACGPAASCRTRSSAPPCGLQLSLHLPHPQHQVAHSSRARQHPVPSLVHQPSAALHSVRTSASTLRRAAIALKAACLPPEPRSAGRSLTPLPGPQATASLGEAGTTRSTARARPPCRACARARTWQPYGACVRARTAHRDSGFACVGLARRRTVPNRACLRKIHARPHYGKARRSSRYEYDRDVLELCPRTIVELHPRIRSERRLIAGRRRAHSSRYGHRRARSLCYRLPLPFVVLPSATPARRIGRGLTASARSSRRPAPCVPAAHTCGAG